MGNLVLWLFLFWALCMVGCGAMGAFLLWPALTLLARYAKLLYWIFRGMGRERLAFAPHRNTCKWSLGNSVTHGIQYTIDSVNVLWLKALYPAWWVAGVMVIGFATFILVFVFTLCSGFTVPEYLLGLIWSCLVVQYCFTWWGVFLYQCCDKNAGLLVCAFCYANAKANS